MRVTPQTKQATRQNILQVAQKLFGQQGFEPTTTREIARSAGIGVGTLFNYFPTKEAIVHTLVADAWTRAMENFAEAEPLDSFQEELFAHIAAILRKLKPFRSYVPVILETSLSPLTVEQAGESVSLRAAHLEVLGQIASRHGMVEALGPLAMQLYWTLFTGVLSFWANDSSPRQEDTLALLDQSLAMFIGWLTSQRCGEQDDAQARQRSTRSPNQRG